MKKPETLQDYFDNAWEWFVAQGNGPSFTDTSGTDVGPFKGATCCYRGPNGAKCAIGASILDEDYTPLIEGVSPVTALRKIDYTVFVVEANGNITSIVDELRQLQLCHDVLIRLHAMPVIGEFSSLIKGKLVNFAEAYGLKVPE